MLSLCALICGPSHAPNVLLLLLLQDAGLKVKEYELIRRNFSDSGNFGEQQQQQQLQPDGQQMSSSGRRYELLPQNAGQQLQLQKQQQQQG
jgi:hypothetical protein